MTPANFLEHWGLIDNPFRAEEARHDSVLARLIARSSVGGGLHAMRAQHGDFEKIAGDPMRPSSAVVFGEKGSGKTTLRIQIAQQVSLHNARQPAPGLRESSGGDGRILLIPYDDLQPVLERLHTRLRRVSRKGESPVLDSLKLVRSVDHLDAILHAAVPRLIDAALEDGASPAPATFAPAAVASEARAAGEDPSGSIASRAVAEAAPIGSVPHTTMAGGAAGLVADLGPDARKSLKRLDKRTKRDLLILQACYDRPEGGTGGAADRTRALRRALGVRSSWRERVQWILALGGWSMPALVLLMLWQTVTPGAAPAAPASGAEPGAFDRVVSFLASVPQWFGLTAKADSTTAVWTTAFFITMGVWLLFLLKLVWVDRFIFRRVAARLFRQLRVTGRSEQSYLLSLKQIPASWRGGGVLPLSDSEGTRLTLVQRLRSVLRAYGYSGIIVIVDRVDEPSIIAGDAERMKAVVWPLLNNAILQQEGVGLKLLLPIELRHMLFRESAAFFQNARMDKQNMVEQLGWTGAMLYDLCDVRMMACRHPDPESLPPAQRPPAMATTLSDLFGDDVPRAALVEALEAMRQPRDAFKFIYRCIAEHCAEVTGFGTSDSTLYRIPRSVIERVRKEQIERLRQLAMGIRPA